MFHITTSDELYVDELNRFEKYKCRKLSVECVLRCSNMAVLSMGLPACVCFQVFVSLHVVFNFFVIRA